MADVNKSASMEREENTSSINESNCENLEKSNSEMNSRNNKRKINEALDSNETYVKRYEAMYLCRHPNGPKWNCCKAARFLNMSDRFVRKWVQRYEDMENESELDRNVSGLPTSAELDKMISELFKKNPKLTYEQAKNILKEKGINVSTSSIRRRLGNKDILM